MPSTRRTFVATGAVLLAGCTSGRPADESPGDETPISSPTDRSPESPEPTAIGETAEVGGLDVRAYDADARYSYFELPFPDFASVTASEDGQFVFVSVDVRGGSDLDVPEIAAFALAVGDRTYPASSEALPPTSEPEGTPYSRTRREGRMRFELPAPIGDGEVRFQLDDGEGEPVEWRFGQEFVARLRQSPPEFEVSDFEAPDAVDAGERIDVSATVANVGEGAGTFRAALNQEGDVMYGGTSTTFELRSGGERAWKGTIDTHAGRDEAVTIHLRFRSSGGDVDHDVRVRPNEATETRSTEG